MITPNIGVWVHGGPFQITFYYDTIQVSSGDFYYFVIHRGQKVDEDCSVPLCRAWVAGPITVSC